MTFSGLVSEVIQVSLIQSQDMLCYREQTILLLAYLFLGIHQIKP